MRVTFFLQIDGFATRFSDAFCPCVCVCRFVCSTSISEAKVERRTWIFFAMLFGKSFISRASWFGIREHGLSLCQQTISIRFFAKRWTFQVEIKEPHLLFDYCYCVLEWGFCTQSIPHRFSWSIKSIRSQITGIAVFDYCVCTKFQPEVLRFGTEMQNEKKIVSRLLELLNDFVKFIRFYSNWRFCAISCLKQTSMFFFHPRFFALSRWNYRIPQRPYTNLYIHFSWNETIRSKLNTDANTRNEKKLPTIFCIHSSHRPRSSAYMKTMFVELCFLMDERQNSVDQKWCGRKERNKN